MKTLKFKCTLLSDVVLNATAATQGEHTSVDFIPGNNFLGIVASGYNNYTPEEQMEIFHSGKVRFGDAHPMADGGVRSLHVPATFFYPKGKNAWECCYAFQGYNRAVDRSDGGKPMQLKQCRSGYYVFSDNNGAPAPVVKSFAVKSAYDSEHRRAKDRQMFGYESLDKGQCFLFEVEVDNDILSEKIKEALAGKHHIGRSRTAQYGLVKIEEFDFGDVPSHQAPVNTLNGRRVAVYADSRLIFLDDAGQPVFQPTARQLGLEGEIDWELSQIRTFQYAPYNGKRQTRDADRCGIEKGSVIFVKCDSAPSQSQYVGSYNNEGFGRVIYNPDFLKYGDGNGKTVYHLQKADEHSAANGEVDLSGTPLLDYLAARKKDYEMEAEITDKVNAFVTNNRILFTGVSASQWGRIRKIAMNHPTKEGIINELFDKTERRWHYPSITDSFEGYRNVNVGFLVHGVAAKKWEKNNRKDKVRDFIDSISNADYVSQAVVNLASEMGKI